MMLPGQVPVENEQGRRTRDQDEDKGQDVDDEMIQIYGEDTRSFNLAAYSPRTEAVVC